MICGSSVVGLLRSAGFPNAQLGPVALCESRFCNPNCSPFQRAFSRPFFILVLVNLPSTELSVLSVTRLRSRLPVRGTRVAQW